MPEIPQDHRENIECPNAFSVVVRTTVLAVLIAISGASFKTDAATKSSAGDKDGSSYAKNKLDGKNPEIESKVCGFSGFFSVIEKEGERFIIMHAGCTTSSGNKTVKAEFTPSANTVLIENDDFEFELSETSYIYLSDGEPILSYINDKKKRVDVKLQKTNNVYNMRRYLRFIK